MWLLVGLGNPGAQYRHNRHNIGFMAAEDIARRHKFSNWKKKFKSDISEGMLGGEKVLLLKPQTFMNASGEAVQEASAFYKIHLENIIVFHDELDLAPGKIRVKKGGGAGGHNGLRSIDEHLGQDYWRVRMGIGHPGNKDLVTPYVLGDFFDEEKEWVDALTESVADQAEKLVTGNMDDFMTKVAEKMRPFTLKKEEAEE